MSARAFARLLPVLTITLVLFFIASARAARAATYSSTPRNLVTSGTAAYFFAFDSPGSCWLWRSDGTAPGTVKISQTGFTTLQVGKGMAAANGRLFFRTGFYFGTIDRLYVSDGTDPGTTEILSNAGYTNADGELYAWFNRPRMPLVGDYLYFSADRSSTDQFGRLFAIDTHNFTAKRLDLSLGFQQTGMVHGDVIGSTLYFDYASTGTQPYALFRTNGTDATTTGIHPLPDPTYLPFGLWRVPSTNIMVLAVWTPQYGRELWRTDGTDAGTTIIKDINPTPPTGNFPLDVSNGSSLPYFFGELNGSVYFTANTSAFNPGTQIWRTDGTDAGTTLVKQLNGVTASIVGSRKLGSILLFGAQIQGEGYQLCKTDGTDAGTTVVKSTNPGSFGSSPQYLTQLNATEVIYRATGPNGQELWKTDGTPEGTVEVKDIYPGAGDSAPWDFTVLPGGIALFRATDPDHGAELWRTDGTTAGTWMVMDLNTFVNTTSIADWERY